MSRFSRMLPLAALTGLALVSACATDDAIVRSPADTPGGELFARYIAMGTSISAGTQSGGLNDSLQAEAFPVLVARQAGAAFGVPNIPFPGCVPPLIAPAILSDARVGGAPPTTCTLRAAPGPRLVNNVAAPGTFIVGAWDNTVTAFPAAADIYKTLVLGGRTQVEAMRRADPTLVSVEFGANELLSVLYTGVPALLMSVADFQSAFNRVVNEIRETAARDVVVVTPSPFQSAVVQPGAFYWALTQGAQPLLPPAAVSQNCAPFLQTGQRNPLSGNLISVQALTSLATLPNQQISCADDAPFLWNNAEYQVFLERANAFTQIQRQAAQANGWIFINANEFLPINEPNRFRRCQALNLPGTATPAPLTPADFQAAVAATCPGPTAPRFFGSMISFDLTHPTGEYHRAVANAIITAINQKHQRNIPTLTVN